MKKLDFSLSTIEAMRIMFIANGRNSGRSNDTLPKEWCLFLMLCQGATCFTNLKYFIPHILHVIVNAVMNEYGMRMDERREYHVHRILSHTGIHLPLSKCKRIVHLLFNVEVTNEHFLKAGHLFVPELLSKLTRNVAASTLRMNPERAYIQIAYSDGSIDTAVHVHSTTTDTHMMETVDTLALRIEGIQTADTPHRARKKMSNVERKKRIEHTIQERRSTKANSELLAKVQSSDARIDNSIHIAQRLVDEGNEDEALKRVRTSMSVNHNSCSEDAKMRYRQFCRQLRNDATAYVSSPTDSSPIAGSSYDPPSSTDQQHVEKEDDTTAPETDDVSTAQTPSSVSQILECPIGLCTFTDPVIAADGITYERCHIEEWLSRSTTSPFTGEALSTTSLVPNVLVRQLTTLHAL